MCDTLLATPESTAGRIMLFGKNSDRQRNEAQTVEHFPRTEHASGASLRCTYISIPQALRTHAVLLCRPCWIWGAEMGANEHGVVIGNEGLHARSAAPEAEALTGMDLLRLALERATTAAEALDVITTLLERHGQGGNCGHLTPNYYNNGFLIADAGEAFVLETVGRQWLSERACEVRTLSNTYSIGRDPQGASQELLAMVRDLQWSEDSRPHFAEAIANPNREHIGHARARRTRSASLLRQHGGELTASHMMNALRDHGPPDPSGGSWEPERAASVTICMHAGTDDRPGQTVASMVSELHEKDAVHWVTATAAPCISIFKPLLMDTPPPSEPLPNDKLDSRTLWWRHERLHRAALQGDFGKLVDEVGSERDALEAQFRDRMRIVRDGGTHAERIEAVNECWRRAGELEDRWMQRVREVPRAASPYLDKWSEMSRMAGLNDSLREGGM